MRIFDFFFQKAISRRISAFQDEMMNRHVAEVENLYRQMRGWRHDYHNHIQMMKAYRALRARGICWPLSRNTAERDRCRICSSDTI